MPRVFISYRHVEPDSTVAAQLAASLEEAGHQVFIDTKIPLGTLWGEVIEANLGEADFLVALVSAAAAASPMVVTEIAEAHRLNVEKSRPMIIPVRLGDGLRLRYPLNAYVSRFQQALWRGPDDTATLIARIKEALVEPVIHRKPASQRQEMINRVRGDWIKGVLEKGLYQAARIELGLTVDQSVVARGLDVLVQRPDEEPEPLKPGTSLEEVFDDHRGQLLILGAPGAGKTTLLLELARDLLERAEQDPEHPIPVVFNLSSWTQSRAPLDEWLIEELNLRSDAPWKLAQEWVGNEQILPMLDGLDEVASEHRHACAEAINSFRREHGWVPIVVCSRQAEYEALPLPQRLALPAAVIVQPLSRTRVKEYLEQAGPSLAGLRTAVHADPRLWELLETPLMLSVVALAYRDEAHRPAQPAPPAASSTADVFRRYLDSMFRRRTRETRYPEAEMRSWLGWLAANMTRRGQTVLFLEDIVPEWFLDRRPSVLAAVALVLVTVALSSTWIWLIVGLLQMASGDSPTQAFFDHWWVWPLCSAPVAIFLSSVYGRRAGPVSALRLQWPGWRKFTSAVFRGGVFGWAAGTVLGYAGCSAVSNDWTLSLQGLQWASAAVGGMGTVTMGLAFAARVLVSAQMTGERGDPGQLVRRSIYSALVCMAVSIAVSSPCVWYRETRSLPDHWDTIIAGFELLSWVGLFAALERGGYFVLRHYLARLLLWWKRLAPWRYVDFLDAAADRVFLRKVGGGYIFVHRMFMEYLAGT